MSQQRARLAVLGAILLGLLAPRAARATQKFGPIQVSGNLQTANIVRTPDQNTYEYIMNRNTAHVRLDYDWLQSGKFYNKYDIPFLESSHLSIVWRGVYDSIYDTKKNMWKGMLAFDRPTWIKSLNKKSTVFLTGQFFFHYLIDNPGCDAQRVFPSEKAKKASGECLIGALDLPSSVRNGSVGNPSYRDKLRDWETLFTLAGFTFYRGGSILPVLGVAVDPTNQFSMEPFWAVDYVVRDDFVVNVAQRYFLTPRGRSTPIFDLGPRRPQQQPLGDRAA